MAQGIRVVIEDGSDPSPGKYGMVNISSSGFGVFLQPEGHGEKTSPDFEGIPIMLSLDNGEYRLYVWSDINQEDPTHIIDLSGARESNRIEE